MSARVERVLNATGRRLAWLVALRRSGWVVMLGAGLLEIALVVDGGSGLAAALLAAALVAGVSALWLNRRAPRPALVAAVVDARLESGGVVAAAAEALAGEHPRFCPLVLAEADRALSGWTPARLMPLRAPPGLVLGAAALILLPALLGGRAAAPQAVASPGPPSLLSPEWVGGGADAGADGPVGEADELTVAEGGQPADSDPLAAFAPELAELLRERLSELAREHGVGGAAASAAGAADASAADQAQAERALAAGDPEQALAALDALADAAAHGDRSAAAALSGLAERAGAGAGLDPTTSPRPPAPSGAPASLDGGRRARLPRLLEATRRRYFELAPTRSTE